MCFNAEFPHSSPRDRGCGIRQSTASFGGGSIEGMWWREHFWWVHGASTSHWVHQSEAAGSVPTLPLAHRVSTPGLWQPSACLWPACKASKLLCIVLQTQEKHSQALLWLHKRSVASASVTCGRKSAWGCKEKEKKTSFLLMNTFSLFLELSKILT